MDIRKSISSVLGRDKDHAQVGSPVEDESTTIGTAGVRRSLVLRRQDGAIGDKILIRLDPDIPRNESIATLLSHGILIDVVKISDGNSSQSPQVTLAIGAADAFIVDRLEKFSAPRQANEVFGRPIAPIEMLTSEALSTLGLEELESRITTADSTLCNLQAEQRRLKTDRRKANDREYHRTSNERYPHYLALVDECDAVTNQIERAEAARQQLLRARTQLKISADRAAQDDWARQFTKTAKGILSEESYDAIVSACRDSKNG